ncbi:MAG: hypothetical protein AAF743_03020 [Planctomycetota bacterium]
MRDNWRFAEGTEELANAAGLIGVPRRIGTGVIALGSRSCGHAAVDMAIVGVPVSMDTAMMDTGRAAGVRDADMQGFEPGQRKKRTCR